MEDRLNYSTTLSQSKELVKLGLSTENADFVYVDGDKDNLVEKDGVLEGEDIPSYSLSRMVEMLPPSIVVKEKQYLLDISYALSSPTINAWQVKYDDDFTDRELVVKISRYLIDTVFKMLCYVIENDYIDEKYLKR